MERSSVSPLYAAIDLGSNSFHMWIVREVAGSVKTLAKIKRKVRLAAGLNHDNVLSEEAMQRGWECLSLFAERLQDIPAERIRIVGTAALRTAVNADTFLAKAKTILGHPVDIIPGEEEARIIYQGVAHTSGGSDKRLVVDIGGASTEVIIGAGFDANALTSLKIGCVTWLERYFKDRELTAANFDAAITAAKTAIEPILEQYQQLGWDTCVGASGTVQALQEIMLEQGMDEVITLQKLKRLQRQAMQYERLEDLDIEGLTLERALVFPSGLSILIALFESLQIETMTLAGGALREGMVYEMMSQMRHHDVRERTLNSVKQRFQLDAIHSGNVAATAAALLQSCQQAWQLEPQAACLLHASSTLHEIGASIEFKKSGEHAAYLIRHLDLPGFTRAQQLLIAELLRRHREQITSLPEQHALSAASATRILRLLRLAIILCHRREHQHQPPTTLTVNDNNLTLSLPSTWLAQNPLTQAELMQEATRQTDMGWPLAIEVQDEQTDSE
ncbi:guanosine-5'-triphosphate,3'-diphosphate pyrophosphatase [Photobacterium jeanii]|uniref:Guanosine-5'-triphosphate,3'-diphosphate pyrophosphatase n=1 Tax=Photobacterium jeanii TaxID=858640 RepID=A0A178KHY0_9GAMM|nr:guanosine-5'-triphosphate,3'-diphosphate diphosphatase [Photobacterium jeanii]OAN16918.1 guanosine-5'-triphosphate,3'-diphosphate pyrophosphatase [Photobacterium jeanii]PST88208.1 guanosine-5'-triphosphate,3'-diphosphate diphosphatase [Photobacterium jeanii]